MRERLFLMPLIVAFAFIGVISAAVGEEKQEEEEKCDEKGPCCDLDWTGQGATIVKIVGEGLVSQSPWVPATVGMRVKNGGRVMALAKSTVVVAFDDGCWEVLEENEMLTVEDVSPCCASAIPPPPVVAVPSPGIGAGALVPAAFAVGVVGCVATDCFGDDREPVSKP